MSFLKFSNQLFLEKQELQRLYEFIVDDGWKKLLRQTLFEAGLVKERADKNFEAWKIIPGTTQDTIQIPRDSYAIDTDGNCIYYPSRDNIALPGIGEYWIKISYLTTVLEVGTVSIDFNGNLTGVDTKFTEVLRGQPNFPSIIKFSGDTSNVNPYQVVEVIDDTTAVLAGNFAASSGMKYSVCGTFTPGYIAPQVDQNPFVYDNCLFEIIKETQAFTPPTVVSGKEFLIARVVLDSNGLTIQDYRNDYYRDKADFDLNNVAVSNNPLIGVESVMFDGPQSNLTRNIVRIGWGMISTNHTFDSSQRILTINTGSGGQYKSTSEFNNGDFNGYLVYTSEFLDNDGTPTSPENYPHPGGLPAKVLNSVKVGSNINLQLDVLNPLNNTYTNQATIFVVPDAENIEIRIAGNGDTTGGTDVEQLKEIYSFPIQDAFCNIPVLVPVPAGNTYDINIQYRYKRANVYSKFRVLPSDDNSQADPGFFNESSFDVNGKLNANPQDRTLVPYTSDELSPNDGYITLTANQNNYSSFQTSIVTGDRFGAETLTMSNSSPNQDFIVGTNRQVVYVKGTITLTTNHVFNLESTGAVSGNSFTFIFDANITTGGKGVTINDGWVNSGSPGTILHFMTPTNYDYMKMPRRNFVYKATYIGNKWVGEVIEDSPSSLGDIKMFGPEVDMTDGVNFDSTGLGVSDEYLGWALANGQNGTTDLKRKFVVGSDYFSQGDYVQNSTGGEAFVQLTADESGLPAHNHSLTGASGTMEGSTNQAGLHNHASEGSMLVRENGGEQVLVAAWDGTSYSGIVKQAGTHSHTVTGSVTLSAGNTGNNTAAGAVVAHENRPPYVALGFCQRIPYGGGSGGPGGTQTYPEPIF